MSSNKATHNNRFESDDMPFHGATGHAATQAER